MAVHFEASGELFIEDLNHVYPQGERQQQQEEEEFTIWLKFVDAGWVRVKNGEPFPEGNDGTEFGERQDDEEGNTAGEEMDGVDVQYPLQLMDDDLYGIN